MEPELCTLCGGDQFKLFYRDLRESHRSDYYRCEECALIFAPARHRPSPDEEFERYEQHNNDPEDEGYRKFLERLFKPMNERIPSKSYGLDFGSGPGPTLHRMFEEQGHDMNIYDPFYADDPSVFGETYDFITATEVVEHLHNPKEELNRLWHSLRPGGYLGIMTRLAKNKEAFSSWHYIRDVTHVTFFSRETFRWLAKKWNADLSFVGNDVILLRKTEAD